MILYDLELARDNREAVTRIRDALAFLDSHPNGYFPAESWDIADIVAVCNDVACGGAEPPVDPAEITMSAFEHELGSWANLLQRTRLADDLRCLTAIQDFSIPLSFDE